MDAYLSMSIVLAAGTGIAPIISQCYQTLRNPYWTVKSAGSKIEAANARLLQKEGILRPNAHPEDKK